MQDNFVDYGKELLLANESQRNKIQFLQRQRLKRDHFLGDLQESLTLNKDTLRQYNLQGANSAAVAILTREAELLIARLKHYYEEYQSINASLLMEQQMRLSDRQLYEQRLVQFENKMADLRKYLHDKEESFTSVVTRLRRYEGLAEPTIQDKLHAFKKEINERHTQQFIADLIKERNHYQRDNEALRKHYFAFNQLRSIIGTRFEGAAELLESFEKEYDVKLGNIGSLKVAGHKEEPAGKWKSQNPNLDLIRLLKKQKLNNQLLEDALNDAIEKNEELSLINQHFERQLEQLSSKCHLLRAQNILFALRLAEYDHHYCRTATNRRKYYEEGQTRGLRHITQERVKEYATSVHRYFENHEQMRRQFCVKMQDDVEKCGKLMCEAKQLKDIVNGEGVLIKSSTVPRLLLDFQLGGGEQEEELVIEQF